MLRSVVPLRDRLPRPFDELYKEMDQLVQQLFGQEEERSGSVERFVPTLNVVETEGAYEVTLDLPGVDPAHVQVELNDGQLSVSGERKFEAEEKGTTLHRVERRYGQFRRVVSLPLPVDDAGISAAYKDGVLKVTLPKSERVKPKRIEVKVAEV